jgi:hypothetical protein
MYHFCICGLPCKQSMLDPPPQKIANDLSCPDLFFFSLPAFSASSCPWTFPLPHAPSLNPGHGGGGESSTGSRVARGSAATHPPMARGTSTWPGAKQGMHTMPGRVDCVVGR